MKIKNLPRLTQIVRLLLRYYGLLNSPLLDFRWLRSAEGRNMRFNELFPFRSRHAFVLVLFAQMKFL